MSFALSRKELAASHQHHWQRLLLAREYDVGVLVHHHMDPELLTLVRTSNLDRHQQMPAERPDVGDHQQLLVVGQGRDGSTHRARGVLVGALPQPADHLLLAEPGLFSIVLRLKLHADRRPLKDEVRQDPPSVLLFAVEEPLQRILSGRKSHGPLRLSLHHREGYTRGSGLQGLTLEFAALCEAPAKHEALLPVNRRRR